MALIRAISNNFLKNFCYKAFVPNVFIVLLILSTAFNIWFELCKSFEICLLYLERLIAVVLISLLFIIIPGIPLRLWTMYL